MVANFAARIAALIALAAASVVVARTGGPSTVGVLSLLRVLPWLAGALLSGSIFGAAPYFLTGSRRDESRFRPTVAAVAVTCGLAGGIAWAFAAPWLVPVFGRAVGTGILALAGVTVFTQLMESTAKACCQGTDDLRGSNRVIVLEELLFLPAYLVLLAAGTSRAAALVGALIAGDVITGGGAWIRLARRGFFREAGRPSIRHARAVYGYGLRAQVGSILLLVNARLDFAIVGVVLGPASLGVYTVASRFAELLRLPALAANYVLLPRFAGLRRDEAAAEARRALHSVAWIPTAAAVPLALAAPVVLPLAFGPAFHSGVVPALVLLAGLAGGGVNGVVGAFLYGIGRPGLNSIGIGMGVVMTLVLDIALIPTFGVTGAAVASSIAYLTTTASLSLFFRSVTTARAARSSPQLIGVTGR